MSTINAPQERLWTKNYISLGIANFLMFVSLQMLLPTLPVYVEDMGADHIIVGLTISFFAASALIARPFAGMALDRIGRKKVLFFGLIWLILASLGYFWITSIFLLLILRVVHGLSWGVTTTSFGTVVSEIVPPAKRGEGLGYFSLSITVSLATAPYFGLWVMNQWGYTWLFALSSAAAVLSLMIVQNAKSSFQVKKIDSKYARNSKRLDIFEKKALLPALLAFLFAATYSSVEVFISLFADEQHIKNIGSFFLVLATMMFVVRPITGKVFDRIGVAWVIFPGIWVTIIGVLLLSYSTTLTMVLIAGGICGAGLSAVMPALQAWMVDRVPTERLGAANGTYFSGIDLGFSIGSSVNAAIAGLTSFAGMYRIIVIYLVIFFVIFLIYQLRERAEKERAHEETVISTNI